MSTIDKYQLDEISEAVIGELTPYIGSRLAVSAFLGPQKREDETDNEFKDRLAKLYQII